LEAILVTQIEENEQRGKTRGASKGEVRREPMVLLFLIFEHLEKLPAYAVYGISASPD
jgi:hypothetical protein